MPTSPNSHQHVIVSQRELHAQIQPLDIFMNKLKEQLEEQLKKVEEQEQFQQVENDIETHLKKLKDQISIIAQIKSEKLETLLLVLAQRAKTEAETERQLYQRDKEEQQKINEFVAGVEKAPPLDELSQTQRMLDEVLKKNLEGLVKLHYDLHHLEQQKWDLEKEKAEIEKEKIKLDDETKKLEKEKAELANAKIAYDTEGEMPHDSKAPALSALESRWSETMRTIQERKQALQARENSILHEITSIGQQIVGKAEEILNTQKKIIEGVGVEMKKISGYLEHLVTGNKLTHGPR